MSFGVADVVEEYASAHDTAALTPVWANSQ